MLKIVDESCLLFDEEYSLLRWKSYNSEIRAVHAEIVADDLLMNVFRMHKLRRSTGSGGAAGWILMIALLAIWLLILWFLWYSCSNDDDLVHGLLWWVFEPWLLISIFCTHTWMSWMSFDSEINHAEFVTRVERSFAFICYFMLNLEDHGDVGPHGWLLDT